MMINNALNDAYTMINQPTISANPVKSCEPPSANHRINQLFFSLLYLEYNAFRVGVANAAAIPNPACNMSNCTGLLTRRYAKVNIAFRIYPANTNFFLFMILSESFPMITVNIPVTIRYVAHARVIFKISPPIFCVKTAKSGPSIPSQKNRVISANNSAFIFLFRMMEIVTMVNRYLTKL